MEKLKRNKIVIITVAAILTVFLVTIFLITNENVLNKSTAIANSYELGGSGRGAEGKPRITYNFNYGWTFSKGTGTLASGSMYTVNPASVTYIPNPDANSSDLDIPYSDNYNPTNYSGTSTWKEVSLPHTYNDEDTFNNYMETYLNGERTMYAGTAWYKKSFKLPASYQTGKKIIIEFEGARQAAKVWINGHSLDGTSQSGFVAFGYELPNEYLNFDGTDNVLTVFVDNSYPYKMELNGTKTNSVVSWHDSHWHPNYGGLYRNSYLYVVDDLHLTIPLYSFTEGTGTYVYTNNISATSADIHIDAEIENGSNTSRTFSYRAIIKDMNGNVVSVKDTSNNIVASLTSASNVTLTSGEKEVVSLTGTINNPIRWSTDYPYLYTVEVEILENDVVVDNNLNTFGIRTFRFTTDYGFYLNEYYTLLDGWGQKPTWEWAAVGAAYPDWMTDYGVKLMKDAGANYIRFGHASGSATQISMCDKYGLLVTQPGVDGEGQGGGAGGAYDANTYKLRFETMRDMIIYFRNHPSIIMWEMGNQATGLTTNATTEFVNSINWIGYESYVGGSKNYATILKDIIDKYDYGNRNATENSVGTYNNSSSYSKRLISLRSIISAIANTIDVVETTMGSGTYPEKPSVEGEYNRYEARRGVWDIFTEGFTDFKNESTSGVEYVNGTSVVFSKNQVALKSDNVTATGNIGGANWIFSDSISHGRLTSEVARASGEVDATMLPKDAYYTSQVIYQDNVGIHIVGHWNYPQGTAKSIYVVAKGVDHIELFINGVSQGQGKQTGYLYTYTGINYQAGYIEAKGYDAGGTVIVSDRITTHGEPDHLEITAVNGPNGVYANGSDILILDVKLLDSNNRICNTYDGEYRQTPLQFTTNLIDNGKTTGEFLGGYNSSIPENTRATSLYLESGITRVFVRTTKNQGAMSVTATMGTMSDTYTTTSLEETNTNGLSTSVNLTPIYALDATKNLGLGTGIKLGAGEVKEASNSKLLIENLTYIGSANENNGVVEGLGVGTNIYSDIPATISTIPYKFLNAEIILTPNDDRGLVDPELIIFEVNRNATVYIARDPAIDLPAWMVGQYTQSIDPITNTVDTITASNGVTYEVWKKDYTVTVTNDVINKVTVNISNNADNGTQAMAGTNMFVFVKETEKVANRTFLNQDFDLFSESNIKDGWGGFVPDENTSIAKSTIDNHTGIRYTDTGSSNVAYTSKYFADISDPFVFEFKAYVSSKKVNTWLRTFLSLGKPKNITDMYNIPIEAYLFKDGSNVVIKYKTSDTTNIAISTSANLPLDSWITYKYHVNPMTHKWYIEAYDENGTLLVTSSIFNFQYISYTSFTESSVIIPIDKINCMTFGTGKSATYTSDFYIDDIKVSKDMDIGASSITINGYQIDLNKETTSYVTIDNILPSNSVVTLDTTDDYYNYTRTNNDETKTTTINLENLKGEHFIFEVEHIASEALENWHIEPAESNPDPTTIATSELKDNALSIHMNDTSTTNNLYIYREIPTYTSAFNLSFDFNLDSNVTYSQEMLKVFLSDGLMTNPTDYDKLGVRSYFTPQNGTTNQYFMVTSKNSNADSSVLDDTLITKDTWHNIKYSINVASNMYSVYLDNIEIIHNYKFYNDATKIDHVLIGTDNIGTANLYIKNVQTEEITARPIEGVVINQSNLPDFDNESDTYYYYTDQTLTNDTEVSLVTNTFYSSSTITKDVENQRIVINVTDNFDDVITYTIIYDSIINRPVTISELQALVDSVDDYNEDDYTFNTWAIVVEKLSAAQDVLDHPLTAIPSDYSIAYFELDTALNNLLVLATYTGYETATIEIIKYSNNLGTSGNETFSFNKVLDNGKQVYHGDVNNVFTSVPYKYMNAEYLLTDNNQYDNALITLKPLQNIDILVFKDRDAGPLTDPDEPVDANKFQYTGEIATSSEGVIYKIYKKSFTATSTTAINVEYDKLINNSLTGNNNIVAFINTSKADNNTFINEDFDIYDAQLFDRVWENKSSIITLNQMPHIAAENVFNTVPDGRNYLRIWSDSVQGTTNTNGWSMIYREMAKLRENIVFKYSASLSSLEGTTNKFNRTWLRQGPGDFENTADSDKANCLVELYLYNNKGASNTKVAAIAAMIDGTMKYMYQGTGIAIDTWVDVEVNMNLLTRKFQVTYGGKTYPSDTTYYNMTNTTTVAKGPNTAVTYADYIYFASRYQGPTDYNLRDVIVYPLDSNFYSDITVLSASIGNYKDLTKHYLYQVTDTTAYNNATATTIEGTLFTDDASSSNPTINTTTIGNDKYTEIQETYVSTSKGTYTRNYKVFYEVNSDNDTNKTDRIYAKSDLVDLLNTARKINGAYYTSASFTNLQAKITIATSALADPTIEINNSNNETDVTRVYLNLQDSIDDLVELAETKFDYKGKITSGTVYENDFVNSEVNITNNSSLTANFDIEVRIKGDYFYAGEVHERYLDTDAPLYPGTSIIMIDKSESIDVYYSYIVTQADYDNSKVKYQLSDFILEGTTNSKFINTYHLTDGIISGNYSFILDFKDASAIPTDNHTISLELNVAGEKVSTSDILSYNLYTNRNDFRVDVETAAQTYATGEAIALSTNFQAPALVVDDVTVIDTTLANKKISSRISLWDSTGDTRIEFPKGTVAVEEANTYALSSDGYLRTNALSNVSSISTNYTMVADFRGIPAGEYAIKTEILATYDGYNGAIGEEVLATATTYVEITSPISCSIHAITENNTDVLKANQQATLNVDVKTICNNSYEDQTITLKLSKKTLSLHSDFGYTIINYQQYVRNSVTESFGIENVYKLKTHANANLTRTEYDDRFQVYFNSNLTSGMYKLEFDVRTGDTIESDFVTFVVK